MLRAVAHQTIGTVRILLLKNVWMGPKSDLSIVQVRNFPARMCGVCLLGEELQAQSPSQSPRSSRGQDCLLQAGKARRIALRRQNQHPRIYCNVTPMAQGDLFI